MTDFGARILFDCDVNNLLKKSEGYGVVCGLSVSGVSTFSGISVSDGVAIVDSSGLPNYVFFYSSTFFTISSDALKPRKALVYVSTNSSLSVATGVPDYAYPPENIGRYTQRPAPPTIPSDSVLVAEIWIPREATSGAQFTIFQETRINAVIPWEVISPIPSPRSLSTGTQGWTYTVPYGYDSRIDAMECYFEIVSASTPAPTRTFFAYTTDADGRITRRWPPTGTFGKRTINYHCGFSLVWWDLIGVQDNLTDQVYPLPTPMVMNEGEKFILTGSISQGDCWVIEHVIRERKKEWY